MSAKVNGAIDFVTIEDASIEGEVSRDIGNTEAIDTEETSERNYLPATSATEMVVTRSKSTELRPQSEEQKRSRELSQPSSSSHEVSM